MFTVRLLVENSIAQIDKSPIIIRNLAAFYNYNFEIGKRNGERRKAISERLTANGEGRKERGTGYKENGIRHMANGKR
jgi:hypothetical protein